jgi:hypothetical protein
MEIAESNFRYGNGAFKYFTFLRLWLWLLLYTLLGSINHTLDNEFTVFIFTSFRDFESFQSICEFKSMRQEWFQVNQSPFYQVNS